MSDNTTNEKWRRDLERQMWALQNGLMTYYRLFDTVNRPDRFHIGEMAFELSNVLQASLEEEYPEAAQLMNEVSELLCELDSCKPHEIPGDCEQHDTFLIIFDLISRIKAIAEIEFEM